MLAPVNKLWTTPPKAVERGLELLELTESSTLLDPGCGDGRILLQAAKTYSCCCHGYEINADRAAQTAREVREAGLDHLITIHATSSLDGDFSLFDSIFGFLVERGLRKVAPLLKQAASIRKRRLAAKMVHVLPASATGEDGDAAAAGSEVSVQGVGVSSSAPAPVLKFLSVLYRIPSGLCAEPVQVEWVKSTELVKTPVYLYHFYGDNRDEPSVRHNKEKAKI